MPFEKPVEIAWILEPEAEGDLLYRDIHLLEAHARILHDPVEDESAGRVAGVAHADGVEPVLRDAEGIRVAFDAPVLPVAEFNELAELLKHIVTRTVQTALCGRIALSEPPDMEADKGEMCAQDRHGGPVGCPHLPG